MTEDDGRRDGQPFGQMSVCILGRPGDQCSNPPGMTETVLTTVDVAGNCVGGWTLEV